MCRFVLACFLLLALNQALALPSLGRQTTQVAQCLYSNGTLPINAYVEGCDQPPCVLHQLENAVINVVFEAPHVLHNLTTKALALVTIIGTIEHDYNLGADAATCNFLTNSYCPVLPKEIVQYTLKMFIEPFFFAGIQATIEFQVLDGDQQSIWCIRVPIRIAPPRPQANKKHLT